MTGRAGTGTFPFPFPLPFSFFGGGAAGGGGLTIGAEVGIGGADLPKLRESALSSIVRRAACSVRWSIPGKNRQFFCGLAGCNCTNL